MRWKHVMPNDITAYTILGFLNELQFQEGSPEWVTHENIKGVLRHDINELRAIGEFAFSMDRGIDLVQQTLDAYNEMLEKEFDMYLPEDALTQLETIRSKLQELAVNIGRTYPTAP